MDSGIVLQDLTEVLPAPALMRPTEPRASTRCHLQACLTIPALCLIEAGGHSRPAHGPILKVAAWNIERCKFPAQSIALLRRLNLDVLLLSELDIGMARSGNISGPEVLASGLRMTYCFGVEFIEFGHGNQTERERFRGEANNKGLHGNAILSAITQTRQCMVRLPGGEKWNGLDWHDDRIGSRMALFSVLNVDGISLLVVSVHLESLPTAEDRRLQFEAVLTSIEQIYPGLPVIIGGDVNTSDLPSAPDFPDPDSDWFAHPEQWEPLFASAKTAGYDWMAANTAQHTRRQLANGWPRLPFKKLDWFFTRNVYVSETRVVAARSEDGSAISDHEILVMTIDLSRRFDGLQPTLANP